MPASVADSLPGLAGVFQAAALVQELATGQPVDEGAVDTLYGSLLQTNPDSIGDVYGEPRQLRLGFGILAYCMGAGSASAELRYALAIIQLERHLAARQDLLQAIGSRLERLKLDPLALRALTAGPDQAEARTELGRRFAAIYSETLSTLRFRIQVQGKPEALQQPETAARVRALLLAGVRSAVLWQQTGGRRWQLVFLRGSLRRRAGARLQQIEADGTT